MLHQFAKDKERENEMSWRLLGPRANPQAVRQAMGQRFDAKVKLAKMEKLLTEDEAASINILHSYRNQVYHRGLGHEPILSALAMFYFRIVAGALGRYEPPFWSISSRDRIPHRARKYVGGNPILHRSTEAFAAAFKRLIEVSDGISFDLLSEGT
jgi:hypothetical protein